MHRSQGPTEPNRNVPTDDGMEKHCDADDDSQLVVHDAVVRVIRKDERRDSRGKDVNDLSSCHGLQE